MFAKATYFGFYPLGADVILQGVKIMQKPWNDCRSPLVVFAKKEKCIPFLFEVYYVTENDTTVFFAAQEHGLGHFHIFILSDKAQKKLIKRIQK